MTKLNELHRELAALDEKHAAVRQRLAEASEERRSLARALLAGDAKASRRDNALADIIRTATRDVEMIETVRTEIGHDIAQEEAAAAAQLRAAKAKEAAEFADALAKRGAEFDAFLNGFRDGVLKLKDELAVARSKGLLPATQKTIELAVAQATRGALWFDLPELELQAPDVRRSFEDYTRRWADAVRGQANRRLAEPVAPPTKDDKPKGWASALAPVSDDELKIYDTKADADRALAAAQKGPNP
jgi:hypothetical protein